MLIRYAIIEGTLVANIIEEREGFTFPGLTLVPMPDGLPIGPGWFYENGEFIAPPPSPEPPPKNYGTKITKLAFRNRFTTNEKVAIEMASLDDPTAAMQARYMAAQLRAYQKDVETATFINLMRDDTRAGVQLLETVGLIGAGRATIILDTAVVEEEIPI